MAYIGNTATTQAFTPAVDYFNGDGSTVAFTLSKPVASVAQVQAVIENVPQNPGSAYTVSGNTITFTSAPPSGTANIYVYYTSPITQVIAPSQGTVGASQLAGGTVNTTADATLNGVTAGRGAGNVATNTAVGASVLAANSSGAQITAVGYQAAYNTTGGFNTAVGYRSGYNLTTGVGNSYFGQNAGPFSNASIGNSNTGIGAGSLYGVTSGSSNTAVGYQSLLTNTNGNNSTAVGYQALYNCNNSGNVGVGYQAGYSTSSGSTNTFVGMQSGYGNTTGTYNTAVGYQAGYSNSTASYNTCIGEFSGQAATGGSNTFVGAASGYLMTTGTKNTILGQYSGNQGGLDIRTANNFVVLSDGDGVPHGYYRASDAYWVFPAVYARTSSSGANVYVDSNGALARSTSSLKYKREVQNATYGLADVMQLRPVTYKGKSENDGETVFGGLIAEEVHDAGLTEFVQYAPDGSPDALAYGNMVSLCIKAIQELSAKVDAQAAEIAALKGA